MPYATQLLYSDSCLMLLSPICLRFHLIHDLWAAFLFDLIDVKPEVILRMGLSKSVYLLFKDLWDFLIKMWLLH